MTNLQVGDRVEVKWGYYIGIMGVKDNLGVVERISSRFVEIRHPAGYTFSVAHYDIVSGTEIIVKERAKMTEAVEFSVLGGSDWRDELTRDRYLQLKKEKWTDRKIAKACSISPPTLAAWKQEHNLVGIKLDAGGDLVFPDDEDGAAQEKQVRIATDSLEARVLTGDEDDTGQGMDTESEPDVEMTVSDALYQIKTLQEEIKQREVEIARIENARVVM